MQSRLRESRHRAKTATILFIDVLRKGAFRRTVERAVEELKDSVTSSGVLSIVPCSLKREPSAGSITEEMLVAAVLKEGKSLMEERTNGKEHHKDWKVSVEPFSQSSVSSTAEVISVEVKDDTPKDRPKDIRHIIRDLTKILDLVPLCQGSRASKVVTARCAIRDEDPEGPPLLHFTVRVFLNLKTKRGILFQLVEGHQ